MKLGKLFKAAINIVTLPADMMSDFFTLNALTKDKRSRTKEKIEKIEENLDQVLE